VVAGKHAKPAGVLRERLGDAELWREVRNRPQLTLLLLPPAVGGQVTAQVVVHFT
jgi:hypothetical protein